jgi:hypothetical protein
MKKYYSIILINTLVAITLYANISLASDVSPQTWTVNNVTVGATTLTDAQKIFGITPVFKINKKDEANIRLCYVFASKDPSFLTFESGVMGGFEQITGFRISTVRPSGKCSLTKVNIDSLATDSGVHLGQNIEDFKKILPVEFKRLGSKLVYETATKRMATKEELEKLRINWPDERQDYFDVTTTIRAKFKDDRLIDFSIQRIESY